jgi:hypothetical protein
MTEEFFVVTFVKNCCGHIYESGIFYSDVHENISVTTLMEEEFS